jgi:phi13 family phage major tail protein
MPNEGKKITEYRGIEGLVYAEITKDTADVFEGGEVKDLAGVAELSKTTESSSEPHYYDNIPAIVVTSTGSDEVTITTSALELAIVAELTGQGYDASTGMLIEGERVTKYFAMGYRTKKTDGSEVLVWRLKGTFSIPDSTHATENDGTDANGQELTYTGISTTHKFTKTGKPAKAVNVDMGLGLVDDTDFFTTVQTPDTVKAKVEQPAN